MASVERRTDGKPVENLARAHASFKKRRNNACGLDGGEAHASAGVRVPAQPAQARHDGQQRGFCVLYRYARYQFLHRVCVAVSAPEEPIAECLAVAVERVKVSL